MYEKVYEESIQKPIQAEKAREEQHKTGKTLTTNARKGREEN